MLVGKNSRWGRYTGSEFSLISSKRVIVCEISNVRDDEHTHTHVRKKILVRPGDDLG